MSLFRWDDPVRSQSGIGIAGVIVVSITVAAGLGFCALLGIPFNAATTQIIPFLALGLGVDNMFHLTHTYAESDSEGNIDVSMSFLSSGTNPEISLLKKYFWAPLLLPKSLTD